MRGNHAEVHHAVGEFDPGLDPRPFIDAQHKPGLVVELAVLADHRGFDCEIPLDWPQISVAVVAPEPVEGLLPEIGPVCGGER